MLVDGVPAWQIRLPVLMQRLCQEGMVDDPCTPIENVGCLKSKQSRGWPYVVVGKRAIPLVILLRTATEVRVGSW
mgnify:CR=1 FL=1